MSYTLGQAARAVGKAKSTISRDIKTGKVSASRNADGSVTIEPIELERAYPLAERRLNGSGNGKSNDLDTAERPGATGFERREIELLREHLTEKDARIADKDAVIADLRRRLDQATALLADKRPTAPAPATDSPHPAWRRVLRALGHVR